MYAHQVIEDNNKIIEKNKNKKINSLSFEDGRFYLETILSINDSIKKSFKFHIDSYKNLTSVFKNFYGTTLFMKNSEYLKLPYNTCWLDYFADQDLKMMGKDDGAVYKRGMLIQKSYKNTILVIIYNFFDIFKHWTLSPVGYLISIGENINERKDELWNLINRKKPLSINSKDGNIQPIVLIPMDHELLQKIYKDDTGDLETIQNFLFLINCKNIQAKPINPPIKLNKKRTKNSLTELFKYHILEIKPKNDTSKGQKTSNYFKTSNRIHFCRGHFKEYTKENPLFGKLTGLYWWQPHVRGNKRKGIVMKDYKIIPDREIIAYG